MSTDKPALPPRSSAQGKTELPEKHGHGVALLLGGAAIIAALIGGRAAAHSASAASAWQEATREQVKEAAAYVETIRYIYGVEVPRAIAVTEIRFRIEELAKLVEDQSLKSSTRSALAMEKAAQESALASIASASVLASDPRYRSDVGFDAVRMLVDDRQETPALLLVDPGETHEEGDRAGDKAIRLIATTTLVAVAFLCGSLARGFPRRRRLWLVAGAVFLTAGLVSGIVIEVA